MTRERELAYRLLDLHRTARSEADGMRFVLDDQLALYPIERRRTRRLCSDGRQLVRDVLDAIEEAALLLQSLTPNP